MYGTLLASRGVAHDNAKDSHRRLGQEEGATEPTPDERTVTTWVYTIALNFYRRLVQRQEHNPPTRVSDTTVIDLAAIDLARILDMCRPCDRLLLEQHLLGVTTKEIAGRQCITETAVRVSSPCPAHRSRVDRQQEDVVWKLPPSGSKGRIESTWPARASVLARSES